VSLAVIVHVGVRLDDCIVQASTTHCYFSIYVFQLIFFVRLQSMYEGVERCIQEFGGED
jgi:hypothetical protein